MQSTGSDGDDNGKVDVNVGGSVIALGQFMHLTRLAVRV